MNMTQESWAEVLMDDAWERAFEGIYRSPDVSSEPQPDEKPSEKETPAQ